MKVVGLLQHRCPGRFHLKGSPITLAHLTVSRIQAHSAYAQRRNLMLLKCARVLWSYGNAQTPTERLSSLMSVSRLAIPRECSVRQAHCLAIPSKWVSKAVTPTTTPIPINP